MILFPDGLIFSKKSEKTADKKIKNERNDFRKIAPRKLENKTTKTPYKDSLKFTNNVEFKPIIKERQTPQKQYSKRKKYIRRKLPLFPLLKDIKAMWRKFHRKFEPLPPRPSYHHPHIHYGHFVPLPYPMYF